MTKHYALCNCDKKCVSSKFRSCPTYIRQKQQNKHQKKVAHLARQRDRYAQHAPGINLQINLFKHHLRLFSVLDKEDWKSGAEACMGHYGWWLYHKYRQSPPDTWRSVPIWGTVDKAAEQMGVPFMIGRVQFLDEVFVDGGPALNERHVPCFRFLAKLRVRHAEPLRSSVWRGVQTMEDLFERLDEKVREKAKWDRDQRRACGEVVSSSSSEEESEEASPTEEVPAPPLPQNQDEQDELAPVEVPPLRDPAIRYGNSEQYSDYVSSIYQADRIEAHQRAIAENAKREEARTAQAQSRMMAAQTATIRADYFKKKQEEEEKKAPVPPPPKTPLPVSAYRPFIAPKPLHGMSATTMAAIMEKETAQTIKQANIAAVVAAGDRAVTEEEHCQVLRQLFVALSGMTSSVAASALTSQLFSSARWGGNFASQDAIRGRLYAVVELLPSYFAEYTKGGISYIKKVGYKMPAIPTLEAELRSAMRSTR